MAPHNKSWLVVSLLHCIATIAAVDERGNESQLRVRELLAATAGDNSTGRAPQLALPLLTFTPFTNVAAYECRLDVIDANTTGASAEQIGMAPLYSAVKWLITVLSRYFPHARE